MVTWVVCDITLCCLDCLVGVAFCYFGFGGLQVWWTWNNLWYGLCLFGCVPFRLLFILTYDLRFNYMIVLLCLICFVGWLVWFCFSYWFRFYVELRVCFLVVCCLLGLFDCGLCCWLNFEITNSCVRYYRLVRYLLLWMLVIEFVAYVDLLVL